jgi:NAD(P)H dehydrogenase (quinone)
MTKYLIVFAHPNPKSFCGFLRDITINQLEKINCQVMQTDLYKQNFNPVVSEKDFQKLKNKDSFSFLNEQIYSYENNFTNYSDTIKKELDKISWADNFIFIFPMWWGSFPAILKGYCDKSFVYGHSWTSTNTFKNGLLKGKKAITVTTCDDSEEGYSTNGCQGMTVDNMLNHFNRATLSFVGTDVYPTYTFYELSKLSKKEVEDQIKNYENYIHNINNNNQLLYKNSD